MCGRYTLINIEELTNRFVTESWKPDIPDNYNVAPGQIMPIVTEDESGKRHIEEMKWGLIPSWSKDPKIGYKLINARAETAFEKPIWRSVIKRKRCLVPATGFYEWKKTADKLKQPYLIHPKQDKLFAFAGVWDAWNDPEGKVVETYSIMTTEPNKEMSRIHDRMPVILHPEDEASWLNSANNGDRGAIESLLLPYEDNGLEMYEVSTEVNSVRNNDENLIKPTD